MARARSSGLSSANRMCGAASPAASSDATPVAAIAFLPSILVTTGSHEGHRDWPAAGAVRDGVVQQILERLLEAQRVAVDDERVRRARQIQGVRLQEGTCLLHHPPYERVQVDRLPLQAEHPRADA